MSEWLSPDGAIVIFGLIVFGVLPAVAYVARLAGKKEAADSIQNLQVQLTGAHLALGSVIGGVNEAKKAFTPGTAKALVDILREHNKKTGAQEIVAPIVEGMPPAAAVARATRRVS